MHESLNDRKHIDIIYVCVCIQKTCLLLPRKIVVNKRQESSSKDLEVGKWYFSLLGKELSSFSWIVLWHFISINTPESHLQLAPVSEHDLTILKGYLLVVYEGGWLFACQYFFHYAMRDSLIGTELTLLLLMVTPPRGSLNPYLPVLRKDLIINSLLGDAAKEGREGGPQKRLNY